jgi:hypothetical protein
MARLSDFQTAPVARNFEAERSVLVNAGKVHRGIVDYRRTHIIETLDAVECFGKYAAMAVTRRARLHTGLDNILCHQNKTQDDGERLHRALDRWLDSDSEKEPEASDSDEAEEEETDEVELIEDVAEENEKHTRTKIPYDELSLDALQRSLDKTFGLDDGASLSRATVMDAIKLGAPDDVASDAIAKLPIVFDINRRAKAPWFHALFTWINKHPQGTKIKDLHQPALQKLLRELQTAA